jgi:hypothetical protein
MTYEEWEKGVPEEIKQDSLWKMKAYRLALFLGDLVWRDAARLAENRHLVSLADQLYRAVGSISANLAEGYSRGSGRDRARFYEYAAEDWTPGLEDDPLLHDPTWSSLLTDVPLPD